MKFGVQKGISNNIWVGNLNKKGDQFLNKEDKTVEVLNAVIDLIRHNDRENMTTELLDSDNRYIFSVEIKPLKENK